jgi:ACS family hexuronate transporter-like MFS transporter
MTLSPVPIRRGWGIAIIAAAGVAIAFLDRQTMAVLAPVVTKDLRLTETQYGLLSSVFALAMFAGSPVAGWWTARWGSRRVFLFAVIAWSVVAMLHSVAVGFVSLLVLRGALGLAEAPSIPCALDTVERALPVTSRPRATGLLFVGSSVGVLVAAPLAVMLNDQFGWRFAFLIGASFALAIWVPSWWLSTSAASATRQALDEQPDRHERRRFSRSMAVLGHRDTLRALAVTAAVMPLITFTTGWEGKWLVSAFHLDQHDLGTYLIPGPLCFDAGAFLFGDLASRRLRSHPDAPPPRLLFAISVVLIVAGDLSAPFSGSAEAAIGCNAIAAVGRGAILPLVLSDMARRLPPQLVAPGSAAVSGMQALTIVVSSLVIGYVVQHHGYTTIIVALSLWVILPCAAWLATARAPAATPPLPEARALPRS